MGFLVFVFGISIDLQFVDVLILYLVSLEVLSPRFALNIYVGSTFTRMCHMKWHMRLEFKKKNNEMRKRGNIVNY